MRKVLKSVLAAAVAAVCVWTASAATTVNVFVHDEGGDDSPLSGVTVVAINWGMNGPSTHTVMDITGSDGKVQFNLPDNMGYALYYSSHGYSPSIADQFNNPDFDNNNSRWFWTNGATLFSTFTLTSGLTDVGTLKQEFINASADTVLFGGVWNMKSQLQGGQGIVRTDGLGAGILVVDNVPFAEANTYNIGLYDPQKNQGIGRNVMSVLDADNPVRAYTGGAKLDFDRAIPPPRIENTTTGGTASDATVEGVIVSTSGKALGHMGFELKGCRGGFEWRTWAHVGEDGRFRIYDKLDVGTTYYVKVNGGCTWEKNSPGGKCYAPFSSPNFNENEICMAVDTLATDNDIVYVSSAEAMLHKITLEEMPKSIGQVRVYVKSSSGRPLPNAEVSINPDGTPWPLNQESCTATFLDGQSNSVHYSTNFANTPGFANFHVKTSSSGYALLEGLPPGNYTLQAWTPFSGGGGGAPYNGNGDAFTNWGDNGTSNHNEWLQAHCLDSGVNDFRVTIATHNPVNGDDLLPEQTMTVYDSNGADLSYSSITFSVQAGAVNTSGLVRGTLRFPGVVDLENTPITITLSYDCRDMQCPTRGNFASVPDLGAAPADHYDYAINVSSGFAYRLQINTVGWARVKNGGGGDMVNLQSTGTAVMDMDFVPAGFVSGTLFKPDGTAFVPGENQWVSVGVNSDRGWTHGQVQKDGSFLMTDVMPGTGRLYVNGSGEGSFNYALASPAPTVNVIAGSSLSVNVNLLDANNVGVAVDVARMPDSTVVLDDGDAILGFRVLPLPAGTILKADTLRAVFFSKSGGDESRIRYSAVTGEMENGPCGNNWNPAGFCAASVPSPTILDFYLLRSGDFSKTPATADLNLYPFYTLISSTKNIIVDNAHANAQVRPAYSSQVSSGVLVNLNPAESLAGTRNATIFGNVVAANFFRQVDYDACGGDFDKFMQYLPLAAVYDANGAFKAVGIVVPPASFIREKDQNNEFDTKFSQGYAAFKAMLDEAPSFNFEVRELEPNKCYTAVVTTPNYPPYQTRVCTGANGTTTSIAVNLDAAVGVGATVAGRVTGTGGVNVTNAAVELSGDGLVTKTAVTNAAGLYKFEGLPEGTVRIKVVAEGYALADKEQDLVGNNTYTVPFALTAAGGSITGTVYSQKLPFAKAQPGALIVAYNDTLNGAAGATALMKTRTGSDGTYKLTGLIPGDVYKVFLKVPGKYTLSLATEAINGNISGMDFTMKPKPMDIEMFARKNQEAGVYEFTVLNPQDFKTGKAMWSAFPYNPGAATELQMDQLNSGELRGTIPLGSLTDTITYVLRGAATSYSNKYVEKELLFGESLKGNAQQHIDDLILGDDSEDEKGRRNNEAAIDQSGDDPSSLVFPPGAVQATAGVPTCSFKGEDKDSDAVKSKVDALGADAFVGDLYTVALSSVAVNENKSVELTLAYDKSSADLKDLSVARYNDSSQKWEQVPGVATVNPLKGTVKVKLKTLASVLDVRKGRVATASFDGRQYVVRPQAAGSGGSGTFAVIKPSVAGDAFAGSKMKVFNYPNPFSLKAKAVTQHNHDAGNLPSLTTNGTFIHVEVPAANGGPCHIRIYTLAGELVNDISSTCEGGKYNYFEWNGRNKGGQEVANGVYYGVVELTGKKPDLEDATFKMAVIK